MLTTKRKVSIYEAKRRFFKGKPFYICPHKLRPDGPFSSACLVLSGKEWLEKAEGWRDKKPLWEGTLKKTAWKMFYNNWKYYNASAEAGVYAAYYIEVELVLTSSVSKG